MNDPIANQLSTMISQMETTVSSIPDLFLMKRATTGTPPLKCDVQKWLVAYEIKEIITILKLIDGSTKEFRSQGEKLAQLYAMKSLGGIFDIDSPSSQEWRAVMKSHGFTFDQLIVFMKALYEWLYHLRELFGQLSITRMHLGDSTWDQLQGCCDFRNQLITHKEGLEDYLVMGVSKSIDDYGVELDLVPHVPLDKMVRDLDRLMAKCPAKLKREWSPEQYYYEKVRFLSNNYNILPKELQKDFKAFIRKRGSISLSSEIIAGLILEIVQRVVPILQPPHVP
jgi:hypothetical protein